MDFRAVALSPPRKIVHADPGTRKHFADGLVFAANSFRNQLGNSSSRFDGRLGLT